MYKTFEKSKQKYFGQLDMKHLNDSGKFWTIIKPFFSSKGMNSNKMMVIENGKFLSEERSIAGVMNNNKYKLNLLLFIKV